MRNASSRLLPPVWLSALFVALFFLLFRPWNGGGTDGVHHYTYLSSFLFDGDMDTVNDYAKSNNSPGDIALQLDRIGPNGFAINSFPIGNAVLWAPFLAVFRGGVLAWGLLTGSPPDWAGDRFAPPYLAALSLATVCYGFLALALTFASCRMLFRRSDAALAAAGVAFASPALYYTFQSGDMTHATSFFCVSLLLYFSLRERHFRTARSFILTAFAGGLMVIVRWQDAVLLLLPGLLFLRSIVRRPGTGAVLAGAGNAIVGAAVLLAVAGIQMVYWNSRFGAFLTVPQGEGYMRWNAPQIRQVLFSGWNGLYYWHPLLLVATAGFAVMLLRPRLRFLAAALALCLAIETYVNGSPFDWFGNVAFGSRRYCSLLPFFAVGLAAIAALFPRRWKVLPALLVAVAVIWNIFLLAGWNRAIMVPWFGDAMLALRGDLGFIVSRWAPTVWMESEPLARLALQPFRMGPIILLCAGFLLLTAVAGAVHRGIGPILSRHALPLVAVAIAALLALQAAMFFSPRRSDPLGVAYRALLQSPASTSLESRRAELRRLLDAGYRNPAAVIHKHAVLKDTENFDRDLALVMAASPRLAARWVQSLPRETVPPDALAKVLPHNPPRDLYPPVDYAILADWHRQRGDDAGERKWLERQFRHGLVRPLHTRRLVELLAAGGGSGESAKRLDAFLRRYLEARFATYLAAAPRITGPGEDIIRDWRVRMFRMHFREDAAELIEIKLVDNDKPGALEMLKRLHPLTGDDEAYVGLLRRVEQQPDRAAP